MTERSDNNFEYKYGEVIFKEGDFQLWMYYIQYGIVGIYAGYGQEGETLLATLEAGDFVGEMGLIDSFPRSATAVALDKEGTCLQKIDAETFDAFFSSKPAKIMAVMQKMASHIRESDKKYIEACKVISEYLDEAENDSPKKESIISKMKKFRILKKKEN